MKRYSQLIFILLSISAMMLSVMYIGGTFKEDDNIVEIIDRGLAYCEADSISLDKIKAGHVFENDTAKSLFQKAYSYFPSDVYVQYCLSACYFLRRDYAQVIKVLGREWHCVESSYLQIQSAVVLNDTLTLKCALKNLIMNKPDILESLFISDVKSRYPIVFAEAASEAKKELSVAIKDSEDVITMAYLAKIELSLGDIHSADTLLSTVTSCMPNLSRPWSYRACVRILSSDTSEVDLTLRRAKALARGDIVPAEIENYLKGDTVRQVAPEYVTGQHSLEHAYDTNFENNTIIIHGLQNYLRPEIIKILEYDTD